MKRIGIFCASAGGTSLLIAKELASAFSVKEDDFINMEEDFDDVAQLLEYDILFIGSSTWGQGDVHHEWVEPQFQIDNNKIDFSGKTIAFFGAGDSVKHAEQFCSALGKLYTTFTKAGAKFIGFVDKKDYNYKFSLAEVNEKFCGLAIDHHNEENKTSIRITKWLNLLKDELSQEG